jgi:hypothetical protein
MTFFTKIVKKNPEIHMGPPKTSMAVAILSRKKQN